MGLHQNKQFRKLGLAEFLGLALLAFAALAVTLWWQASGRPVYAQADGRVVEGNVAWVHYNATDLRQKVSVTYEYPVGADTYTSSWSGFWPEDSSPNALPSDRLQDLCVKDHPLVVLYDPESPSTSYLHPAEGGSETLRQGVAVGACVLALLYCAVLYPTWRSRG